MFHVEHSSASRTRACVPAPVRECGCQLGEARRVGGEPVLTCESEWQPSQGSRPGIARVRSFPGDRSSVRPHCRPAVMSVRGTSWRSTHGRASRRRFDGVRSRPPPLPGHGDCNRARCRWAVRADVHLRLPVRSHKGAREWRTWDVGRDVSRGTVGCSPRSCMTRGLHRCSQGSPQSTARRRATAPTGDLGPSNRDHRFLSAPDRVLGSRAGCSGRVAGTQRSTALLFHVKPSAPQVRPVMLAVRRRSFLPCRPCSTRVEAVRCMPVARRTVVRAQSTHPHGVVVRESAERVATTPPMTWTRPRRQHPTSLSRCEHGQCGHAGHFASGRITTAQVAPTKSGCRSRHSMADRRRELSTQASPLLVGCALEVVRWALGTRRTPLSRTRTATALTGAAC